MNDNVHKNRIIEHKYLKRLNELGSEYQKCLLNLAKKEYEYQTIKTTTILTMQANGESATAINNKIRGIENVAVKRLERDIAKAEVVSKQEQINILKIQIKSIGDD